MKKLCALFILLLHFSPAHSGIITTVVGTGASGHTGDGGSALSATLSHPRALALDNNGNLYIGDDHVVRKVTSSGIISTIAGISSLIGNSGDGGPATAATLNQITGLAVDATGNLYISDGSNNRVRKVNTAGIITAFAGTGVSGYSGDGGPATNAKFQSTYGIAVDSIGNVYVADVFNERVRKITPSGIITTFAGGYPYSADGVPATLARVPNPTGLVFDRHGNLYISDGYYSIRKVNTSGIITTVAGCTCGYIGDWVPATTCGLGYITGVGVDSIGNIFIPSDGNSRVLKVNPAGIMTTIAGNGVAGFYGEGQVSSMSKVNYPWNAVADNHNNVYFTDHSNNRVRKISLSPDVNSDSFNVYITKSCTGPTLALITNSYSPSMSVKTYFGDNSSSISTVSPSGTNGYSSIVHSYASTGIFSIKHILYIGAVKIDSVEYSYQQQLCNDLQFKMYFDANSNCLNDTLDHPITLPVTARIDSNGIPIDTISITTGMYYRTYGVSGDVYSFRVISTPAGFSPSCPLSGVIYDTLQPFPYNNHERQIGFNCSSSTNFDLAQNFATRAGRHRQDGDILLHNNYCTSTNAVVKLSFSPKYSFYNSFPAPTSIIGNTVTWNLSAVSAAAPLPRKIHFVLERPVDSAWLFPGDTVNSMIIVNPVTGDVDTSNNHIVRIDTVKSSFDPNDIAVTPEGYILNGTKIQYTVRFENTGNDTAHNIHVMDTLSDYLNPSTIEMVGSSAVMNFAKYTWSGHTIIKFDFPNIKLLDSSHHGLCDGMFVFKIKARAGLAHGTLIPHRVGIYFDDNDVVMTNTVYNTILVPSIAISSSATSTSCVGDVINFTATSASMRTPRYQWKVNALTTGTDTSVFSTSTLSNGDTVKCFLYNPAGDTLIATSNYIVTVLNTLPSSIISGPITVCQSSSVTLTHPTSGGVWSTSNSNATVLSGLVTGINAGIVTISYAVANVCGSVVAMTNFTVNPLPNAGSISGPSDVCPTASITLTNTASSGVWSASNTNISLIGGTVTGNTTGSSVVSYIVTNSCGTATTTHDLTILAVPDAGAISGTENVCVGESVTLSATAPSGIWSADNSNASVSGGIVTGLVVGTVTINYSVANICGTDTTGKLMTVDECPNSVNTTTPSTAVQFFPNPAVDFITIVTGQNVYNHCVVTNCIGQIMFSISLTTAKTNLNISTLPPGIYYIRLLGNNETTIQNFLKQ